MKFLRSVKTPAGFLAATVLPAVARFFLVPLGGIALMLAAGTVTAAVDLVPTAVSTTAASVVAGAALAITDTVQNQGASNMTAANIVVKYFLSADTAIKATDRLLGSRTIAKAALTAGASSTATKSFTVPAATPAGAYYIGVIVDARKAQAETSETNNTRASSTTITVTATPTLPACTAITPATPSVALGSASPLLTATCSNSPTSYIWKVGSSTLGCTGQTCTVPAASLPTAGTYTVTVTANNGNGAGTQAASATITVSGSSGTSNLNDTGISKCYEAGSDVLVACNSLGAIALNSAQDGMVGRDADPATNSNTNGYLGFNFSSVSGGCVLDNVTGLMWEAKTNDGGLRDANKTYTNYDSTTEIQKWPGMVPTQAEVDASTNSVGFKNSVNAQGLCGHNDWRLPTIDELQSIEFYGGVDYPYATIDTTWFPYTQNGQYWSSTNGNTGLYAASYYAWAADFSEGHVAWESGRGDVIQHVRLVRAGKPQTLPRYTVSSDGQEVTDNETKLIWRRCPEGMNWNGSTCIGTFVYYTHEAALQHAAAQASSTGVAWRLPNIKELSSIADKSRSYPAINTTVFPATPTVWFWSSSPYGCLYTCLSDLSEMAWIVDFYYGNVNPASRLNGGGRRLVRDSQ